jgi:hypothetical protein
MAAAVIVQDGTKTYLYQVSITLSTAFAGGLNQQISLKASIMYPIGYQSLTLPPITNISPSRYVLCKKK